MAPPDTNRKSVNMESQTIALMAIGWIVSDGERADRFLSMTGIDPDDLRARLTDPTVLAAALGFLCGFEPDLMACADAIGVAPADIAAAERALAA